MLDIDAGKLLIIGAVALVVIGPKDLPRVLRQIGQAVGRLRRMAGEFQGQFMEAIKEADLEDLRSEVAKLKDTASLDVHFDPARDIQKELVGAVDRPTASKTFPSMADTAAAPALAAPTAVPASADAVPVASDAASPAVVPSVEVPAPPAAEQALLEEGSDPAAKARRKVIVPRRGDSARLKVLAGRERGSLASRPRFVRQPRHETPDP